MTPFFIATAPKPKVGEPLPANIPTSWGPAIISAASVIAFAILPVLHNTFPQIPAMNVTSVQGALAVLVSVGLWVHQVGMQAALNYFTQNILPVLIQKLAPQIQQTIEDVIKAELNKNGDVGVLSPEDVHAVKTARLNRVAPGTNG